MPERPIAPTVRGHYPEPFTEAAVRGSAALEQKLIDTGYMPADEGHFTKLVAEYDARDARILQEGLPDAA